MRASQGQLQKELAAEVGVSPSVVSESLKAASAEAIANGIAALEATLTQFGPDKEISPEPVDKSNIGMKSKHSSKDSESG